MTFGGWAGRTAAVDLSTGDIKVSETDRDLFHSYIGGRGVAARLLSEMISPDIDPLSDENLLIISTGPLTGLTTMSGRHSITTKSPLTGTIFDSTAGGFFGKEMKWAGLDLLVITGKSERPVYLDISEGEDGPLVEIRDASHLWGLSTSKTLDRFDSPALAIGPAGEKGFLTANVCNDYSHFSGRGGLGAVFGSKNLKAIAVKGTRKPVVSRPDDFKKANREALRLLTASPPVSKGLAAYGTAVLVNLINYMRVMPTSNFRRSHFENAENVSGESIAEAYEIKKDPCWNCPVGCNRKLKKDGKWLPVPEYESIWAFGPDVENDDMDSIVEANLLCNDYGMDTITTGTTLAAKKEIEGDFQLVEQVRKIGEGAAPELQNGSLRYARAMNREDVSMSVKGLELPAYDPRGIYGQALSYATSTRGGDHLRGYMVSPEIIGKPKLIDRLSFSDKPALVMLFQNLSAVIDSLIVCKFSSFALTEDEYASLLSAATGVDYTAEDLLRIGGRIYDIEHEFNAGAGFAEEDDDLPERIFDTLPRAEFLKARDEYYRLRGWK